MGAAALIACALGQMEKNVAEHRSGFAVAQAQSAALTRMPWFNTFITAVIVAAGVFVGVDTYLIGSNTTILSVIDKIIVVIFFVELMLRFIGEGAQPKQFLRSGWNVLDFFLVALSLIPAAGAFTSAVRLVRLLRVVRLLRNMRKLHMLVRAAANSVPSIASISVLLALLFYVYAVAGVYFFSANDPVHFPNLHTSLLSLFRVVTLEDWTDVMYIQIYGCENYGYDAIMERCTDSKEFGPFGALFFTSFVFVGTWIMLNLFIGIIITGMDEARMEIEDAESDGPDPDSPEAEGHAQLRTPDLPPDTDAQMTAITHSELAALQMDLIRLQSRITAIQSSGDIGVAEPVQFGTDALTGGGANRPAADDPPRRRRSWNGDARNGSADESRPSPLALATYDEELD